MENKDPLLKKMITGIILFATATNLYLFGAAAHWEWDIRKWGEVRKERALQDERNNLKRQYLSDLGERIIKKAARQDGNLGLSFLEQASLLSELGYEGVVREGEKIRPFVGYKNLYMEIYDGGYHGRTTYFKIPEEKAKAYLE